MEIARHQREGYLELTVEGRLDGYWAQHLSGSVGEVMREGTHAVRLNLSKLSYISSAGIGALVELHQKFKAVNGSFTVIEPSSGVLRVLEMVGLATMLAGGPSPVAVTAVAAAPARALERREAGGAIFEVHEYQVGATMRCTLVGRPERLANAGFNAEDCRAIAVNEDRVALGLGAFGDHFDACRGSFGEFLAIAGGAASQPTDGTNFPDYMLSSGSYVPHLSTLYGLCCDGAFAKLVRFESASGRDPVALSLIVDMCLEVAGASTAAIVVMAESAGLMGAALKRSPAVAEQGTRVFAYPEIRRWLSFSPERSFAHALALLGGVATTSAPEELRAFVRPMARRSQAAGHFHAAAFGYRPLQKGRLEMRSSVRGLYEAGGLQGVMHVLS
ncbi:MAG: anti-sigma factor antagonist, partial [Candidatus Solibacter sp.]|nr:anti-sigma factor antagonist [Candidatus Solibacter sp.]